MNPIKLSSGYAYAVEHRREALIAIIEDGQPQSAFTLTVDDLRLLLAAFDEDVSPQAAPVVPERVRQNMDVLYAHICANTYRNSPVRLAANAVYGYLHGAWATPQSESTK